MRGEKLPETESVLVATTAMMIASLIASAYFSSHLGPYEPFKNNFTRFAFESYSTGPIRFIVFAAIGTISLREDKWFIPISISFILCMLSVGGWAWDGPGYMLKEIRPLLDLRTNLGFFVLGFTWLQLILWRLIPHPQIALSVPRMGPISRRFVSPE